METYVSFTSTGMFCVSYSLASFILSVEEKSQTTLELL